MDINSSKPWVKDRRACCATVHEIAKSGTGLVTEKWQQQYE